MKNTNHQRFGFWQSVALIVVISALIIAIILSKPLLEFFFGSSKKDTDVVATTASSALVIDTITGKEEIDTGDIIMTDFIVFRIEFGVGTEEKFAFFERIEGRGSNAGVCSEFTYEKNRIDYYFNGGFDNSPKGHVRLIKVGTTRHKELSKRFPERTFPEPNKPKTELSKENSPDKSSMWNIMP